jgi:hypothetical protein
MVTKFLGAALLAAGLLGFFNTSEAQAQVVTTVAPVVTYYRPNPILRPFTWAPAVRYAPAAVVAPTTTFYAPATTTYYAPAAATTTYYAPSAVATPVTTYYAPSTTVTTPVTTYYTPPTVVYPSW